MARLCKVGMAVLLAAVCALGQGGGNAALTGTVVDPTGAAVAAAKVTLTQVGTDVRRTAVSNSNGQFNIPSLPPANYRLSVEASGFKIYVQSMTLLADQSGNVQVPLQLGQAQETVTVDATATLVNTETPVISQVIER
ncbi:MAG TPA: carboxypeptidase-like regulatory domain-containing protein, partial [Bryobacteraceae bacterium]|nr:carboxypeptidase-like regulatory domain-containing protein [Bryobacteraceae bacterium]